MKAHARTKKSEKRDRDPPDSRRARLDVEERRAQLVKLGMEIFSARTYDEVSIDELARAAGISKGLLYHYFPTKRDFYVATVREGAAQLVERVSTAAPESVDKVEGLRIGLDAYLDYVERHGPAYVALLRGGIGFDPQVAKIIDETRERFTERLRGAMEIEQSDERIRMAFRGWVGFVEATSLTWIAEPRLSRIQLRDLMVDVLLATYAAASRG